MSQTIVRISSAMMGFSLGLLRSTSAFAQGAGQGGLPLQTPERILSLPGFSSVAATIKTIFNLVILIAGTIFIILLLVGGIQYLTAAGNEENTTKAKKLIVDAVVGLVIVLAAWAIGTFIIGRLGLGVTTGGITFE